MADDERLPEPRPNADVEADTDPLARTDMIAAALRQESADLAVYARVLTETLAEALPPETVVVERERSMSDRLRGREGVVAGIHVRLGETALILRHDRGAPVGEVVREVRGVVLSRQPVSLDVWLETLARGITEAASHSARGREALQRFLLR
jgi:hypothetical protein